MNLRFGGSGYAITKMGVNLPAMFVKYCQGEEWKQSVMDIRESAIYVNERMLMDDWNSGFITYNELKQYLKDADIHFISDDDDSMPERRFHQELKKRRVVKVIKKLIKR